MSSATPTDAADVVLRPASLEDAASVTAVHLASRRAAVAAGTMPPGIHDDDDVAAWLAARLQVDEVWVGECGGSVVAYARLSEEWLDDLYVLPGHAGQGIGSALLGIAQALRPDGFGLWVFESNRPARDFYLARGLVEVERTDGSANEEQAPDLHLAWRP